MSSGSLDIHCLASEDVGMMEDLLNLFGEAFEDPDSYGRARPTSAYLQKLLSQDHFIALAAVADGAIVGGLAAYILDKFEQERSEAYIYDLAVAQTYRRRGVATAMIEALKPIAVERGAYVIFVQADLGDEPATALYTKLGIREDVLHFDIQPTRFSEV